MIKLTDFVYDEDDVISDSIVNFYINNKADEKFIEKYISDNRFQKFVKKISIPYLMRLYNDYDSDNIVNEYDYITSVNTTRWIWSRLMSTFCLIWLL